MFKLVVEDIRDDIDGEEDGNYDNDDNHKLIKVVHMGFIVVMTSTLSRRFNFVGEKIGKDRLVTNQGFIKARNLYRQFRYNAPKPHHHL